MDIQKEINDGKAIVYLEGEIDFTNSQDFKNELLKIYDQNIKDVEIDFGKLESIDSSGLGKILLFNKKLEEINGELKIKNVKSEYIREMFEMIQLNKVIKIID